MGTEYFRPIQVELGLCIHCERCAMTCPNKAIHFNGFQRFIDYTKCRGCLSCVNVCPRNAITVTSAEKDDIIGVETVFEKCNACGDCVESCTKNLWKEYDYKLADGSKKKVYWVPPSDIYECAGCEICVESCPEGIVSIKRFSPDK